MGKKIILVGVCILLVLCGELFIFPSTNHAQSLKGIGECEAAIALFILASAKHAQSLKNRSERIMECEATITGKTNNSIVVLEREMIVNKETLITIGRIANVELWKLRSPSRAKISYVDTGSNRLLVREIVILPKGHPVKKRQVDMLPR